MNEAKPDAVGNDKLKGSEGAGAQTLDSPASRESFRGEPSTPSQPSGGTAGNVAISEGAADPGSPEPPSLPDIDCDQDDSPYCECGAVHSLGTEEMDCGCCSACGKTI